MTNLALFSTGIVVGFVFAILALITVALCVFGGDE